MKPLNSEQFQNPVIELISRIIRDVNGSMPSIGVRNYSMPRCQAVKRSVSRSVRNIIWTIK